MFANNGRDGRKGWVVGDNEGNTFRFVQCGSVMGRKCLCSVKSALLLWFDISTYS